MKRLLMSVILAGLCAHSLAQSTPTSMPATSTSQGLWFQKPMRIVQTLLREPDVEDYDVKELIAYLKATNANCIVMNGGGILDFFRHDHEMANPTPFLKNRDILAEVTEACHREGIRVIARVDFRGVEKERYDKHPDWFAVDAQGQPYSKSTKLYESCFNGKYRNEYGEYMIRYLLEKYDVDGIWYNSIHAVSVCYCAECQAKYKAATGEEIPKVSEEDVMTAAELKPYWQLKNKWALEHVGKVRDAIKEYGPGKTLSAEIFGMYGSRSAFFGGIDLYTVSPYFDFLIGKAFVNDGQDVSYASSTIRFLKALDPNKPAVLLTMSNRNDLRLISEPPVDLQRWLWETVGAGGGLWNALVAGSNPEEFSDRRTIHDAAEAYGFLKDNADLLEHQNPVGQVKVFYSKANRDQFNDSFSAPMQGVERNLLENHVPYAFLPDLYFNAESLKGVKLLILPDVAPLSDAQIAMIREFVKSGGCLISGYHTSLYDENVQARENFGLADVFGVNYAGELNDAKKTFYLKIRSRHEILRGWEKTDILLSGGRWAECRANGAETVATFIPSYPTQPPEGAYIRQFDTDSVGIAVNKFGAGTSVYFAHELMRSCNEGGHPDFSGILASAVDYCLGAEKIMDSDAPPSLRMSLLSDGNGRYVLSMVNHTAAPYKPTRQVVPVRDVNVTLNLGAELKEWKALKSDGAVTVEPQQDGQLRVHLDEVKLASIVAVEVNP